MKENLKAGQMITALYKVLQKNIRLYVFMFLFLLAMLTGAILVKNIDESLLEKLVTVFAAERTRQTVIKTFLYSLWSAMPLFFLLFLCGLSPAGTPLIVLAPIYKGLGTGVTMGYLYSAWGLKGVVYSFILIVPATFIYALALSFCCREAHRFSALLRREMGANAQGTVLYDEVRLYRKRFLLLVVPILLSCIVDVILSLSFSRFF